MKDHRRQTVSQNKNVRSWYLVVTKPQSEFKAQDNLNRQGYETYLPLVQTTRRRNGKNVKRTEAFFPRYLFIHLDTESDNWSPIRSTIGVAGMVRFGGLPAVVPETLINKLINSEDEIGNQSINKKELKPGEQVEIIDGPFAGYKAIYQKMKSTKRVSVLLDIVGKNTQLTLSVHELEIVQ